MTLVAAANALQLVRGATRSEQLYDAGAAISVERDRNRFPSSLVCQPAVFYILQSFKTDFRHGVAALTAVFDSTGCTCCSLEG